MEEYFQTREKVGEDTHREYMKRRCFMTMRRILVMYGITESIKIQGVTDYMENIFDVLYKKNMLLRMTTPEILSAFDESASIQVMRKLEGYEMKRGS